MAHRQTKLVVVTTPDRLASIFTPTMHPIFVGTDSEDLLCGSCSVILTEGVSEANVRQRLAAPVQLLIKCPKCGSHNRLPVQVGN
jgi:hypothetical protein